MLIVEAAATLIASARNILSPKVLRRIQQEHRQWTKKNFDQRDPYLTLMHPWQSVLELADYTGHYAHSVLKLDQGIRGDENHHLNEAARSVLHIKGWMRTRQKWTLRQAGEPENIPLAASRRREIQAVAGIVEEAGELARACLAADFPAMEDAVGDVVLYLMELCNKKGWDLQQIVEETAKQVHARDWNV